MGKAGWQARCGETRSRPAGLGSAVPHVEPCPLEICCGDHLDGRFEEPVACCNDVLLPFHLLLQTSHVDLQHCLDTLPR